MPPAETSQKVCVLTQRTLTNRGSHQSFLLLEVSLGGCSFVFQAFSLCRPSGRKTCSQADSLHLEPLNFMGFPDEAVKNCLAETGFLGPFCSFAETEAVGRPF